MRDVAFSFPKGGQSKRDHIDPVIKVLPECALADHFLQDNHGGVKFNLWESNRYILEQIGVESIGVADLCTACHLDDWFSHRAENGKTGRFGVLIGISDGRFRG